MDNNNETSDDNGGRHGSQAKKRQIPGTCDRCKRRKLRCDSAQMPGNRCSHCIQLECECTHEEVITVLTPAKGFVDKPETRAQKMERLLEKLLPTPPRRIYIPEEVEQLEGSVGQLEMGEAEDSESEGSESESEVEHDSLPRNDEALEVEERYTGESTDLLPSISSRRESLFSEYPVTRAEGDVPHYIFPDDDLRPSLIDAYFKHFNPFFPLLHRPTFQKSVDEGLHRVDPGFGAVYLLVCAHGALYSQDTRVFADGTDFPRSAGRQWFRQICVYRRSFAKLKATLYELQTIALYILFGHATNEFAHGEWTTIELALRMARDICAHRKRRRDHESPTAEDELWKRALWVIFSMEQILCSFFCSSWAKQDEYVVLDLPLNCDDEYWERGFQQPANKPSSIAYFIRFLELMDILARAFRMLYWHPSEYLWPRLPNPSDQELVAELDSMMNKWMDSVPHHLKWNPNRENQLFLRQSAALHALYYHLQIYIHRRFIPLPRNPHPGIFPSLAICTNAARSCCHVIEVFAQSDMLALKHLQLATFTSAVILLLNICSGKRSGYAPNPLRYMEDVQRCLAILKASDQRCASAGWHWNILNRLASAGQISLPEQDNSNLLGKKRQREAWDDLVTNESSSIDQGAGYKSRKIVGRPRTPLNMDGVSERLLQQPAYFPLPMYSNQMGRLPIYGQHTFLDSSFVNQQPKPALPSYFSSSSSSSLPQQESFSRSSRNAPSPASFPNQGNGSVQLPWAAQSYTSRHDVGDFLPSISNATVTPEVYAQDMPAMDSDILDMWLTAPINTDLAAWDKYISTMGQVTQGRN